jgi:hypothetical protein
MPRTEVAHRVADAPRAVPHTARDREQREPEHGVRNAVPYLDVRHAQQPAAEGRTDPAGNGRHPCRCYRSCHLYCIFRDVYCISAPAFRIRQKDNVNATRKSQLYFLDFRNSADSITLEGGFRKSWTPGAELPGVRRRAAMDLLNALLDLADAISAGVALAAFWHTWVVPADPRRLSPTSASGPDELERFIRAAALLRPSSHRLS